MDDGTEIETGPGDITSLPEGYDAWVLRATSRSSRCSGSAQ
jgi:hypothetical protein